MPSLTDPCPHPHNTSDGHHDVRFQGGREICEDCGATSDGQGAESGAHGSLVDQAKHDLKCGMAEAARAGHLDLALRCEVALLALGGSAETPALESARSLLQPASGRLRKA